MHMAGWTAVEFGLYLAIDQMATARADADKFVFVLVDGKPNGFVFNYGQAWQNCDWGPVLGDYSYRNSEICSYNTETNWLPATYCCNSDSTLVKAATALKATGATVMAVGHAACSNGRFCRVCRARKMVGRRSQGPG